MVDIGHYRESVNGTESTSHCPSFSKHLEHLMVPSPAQVSKRPKLYSFTNAKETAARCLLGLLRSLRTKSQLEQEITTTSSESSVALSWSCSMEKLQCRHDIWLSDIMSLKPGLSQSQLSHKHERGFWWSVGKSWHGHKAKGGSIYTKKQQKKKKVLDFSQINLEPHTSGTLWHNHTGFGSA